VTEEFLDFVLISNTIDFFLLVRKKEIKLKKTKLIEIFNQEKFK
jgi:hypothetical protein